MSLEHPSDSSSTPPKAVPSAALATASTAAAIGTPTEEPLIGDGKEMSIFEHLDELRARIVKSLWAVFICFILFAIVSDRILNFLKIPLVEALPPGQTALHFTGPMDVFIIEMKVAFIAAIIGSAPYWLLQFWKFIEPGLYPRERRYIVPIALSTAVCFLSGVAFCYYVMLPMALKYLIQIGLGVGAPVIMVNDYVSIVGLLLLGFGFVFETPVILTLLGLLGVVTAEGLASVRRYTIVGVLIIAAAIVPPDVISQLSMAVPMYLLYELSIILIRVFKRKADGEAATKGAAAKGS